MSTRRSGPEHPGSRGQAESHITTELVAGHDVEGAVAIQVDDGEARRPLAQRQHLGSSEGAVPSATVEVTRGVIVRRRDEIEGAVCVHVRSHDVHLSSRARVDGHARPERSISETPVEHEGGRRDGQDRHVQLSVRVEVSRREVDRELTRAGVQPSGEVSGPIASEEGNLICFVIDPHDVEVTVPVEVPKDDVPKSRGTRGYPGLGEATVTLVPPHPEASRAVCRDDVQRSIPVEVDVVGSLERSEGRR